MLVRVSVRLSLFKIFFIRARGLENPFSQLLEDFFSLLPGYFESGSCQLRGNTHILEGQSQTDRCTSSVIPWDYPADTLSSVSSLTPVPHKSFSARVKPHPFPLEESTCSHMQRPKSAWERPGCEETCWAEALFCPSLDLSLPRRLVLGTTGTHHPLELFWGYRPLVLHSSNVLPISRFLLAPRERINPLWAAKDVDSRPNRHRGSRDSHLKEQLYTWICADKNRGRQSLFICPRYTKAGSFSEGAWHISSPRYWIPALFPQTLLQ